MNNTRLLWDRLAYFLERKRNVRYFFIYLLLLKYTFAHLQQSDVDSAEESTPVSVAAAVAQQAAAVAVAQQAAAVHAAAAAASAAVANANAVASPDKALVPVSQASQPKRLHVSNIPFRFRDPDLRNMFGVRRAPFVYTSNSTACTKHLCFLICRREIKVLIFNVLYFSNMAQFLM